jgi:hypothetical protein
MTEAKSGNLHYIFLQAYVNEPIISMPELFGNVPDYSRSPPDLSICKK